MNVTRKTARKRIVKRWGWKGWHLFISIFSERSRYLEFELRIFTSLSKDGTSWEAAKESADPTRLASVVNSKKLPASVRRPRGVDESKSSSLRTST